MRNFFSLMLAIFSAPFAAASLYGLISKYVTVGVGPVSEDFLIFYQTHVSPILLWLPDIVPFDFPDWYNQLASLSVICSVSVVRSLFFTNRKNFMDSQKSWEKNVMEGLGLPTPSWMERLDGIGLTMTQFSLVLFLGYSLLGLLIMAVFILILIFVLFAGRINRLKREYSSDPDINGGAFVIYSMVFFAISIAALVTAFVEGWYSAGGGT